jgi:hypothetical protein
MRDELARKVGTGADGVDDFGAGSHTSGVMDGWLRRVTAPPQNPQSLEGDDSVGEYLMRKVDHAFRRQSAWHLGRNGFPSERHNRRGRLPSQYIPDQTQLVTEPTAGACHMVS